MLSPSTIMILCFIVRGVITFELL